MNPLFAVVLSVIAFDMGKHPYVVKPGAEISIQHNKLQISPPPKEVEVIDSKGRNVVVGVEGDIVHLKAKEKSGYSCGPMVVRADGEEFKFSIRAHHGPCEEHQH